MMMKSATLGCVLAGVLLLPGSSQAHGSDLVPVLEGDALVRASINDELVEKHDGTTLTPGMGVRAPNGRAAVVKVSDGMTLRLAPDSTVSVRQPASLPAEHPGASALKSFQLSLSDGELDVDVHDPNLGLIVQLTNGRSIGVWRGSANIAIRGDTVAVALYDGMAIAGSASKWKALGPGAGVLLSAKGDPSSPRPTPSKPEWNESPKGEPASFAMVRGDEKAVLGASWNAAKNAESYRVEVGRDARMTGEETIFRADEPKMKTDPLAAGAYVTRVRAISPDGIVGPPSSPKALRVLKWEVPASALAARDGAIVLPSNAGILLDDPRDLQVATAFDGSDLTAWSPAPNEITLGAATRRDVHIRHVPSHAETRILLVKRELRAKVSFTPRHARWPGQPVDIVVKVEDPTGYLDPSKEKVDVDVRLDIDKVDLKWTQVSDTWGARLDPRTTGGPWVVRVNVLDKAGVSIGSNLLDIDGGPAERQMNAAYRAE
jgi:hypothetical protein